MSCRSVNNLQRDPGPLLTRSRTFKPHSLILAGYCCMFSADLAQVVVMTFCKGFKVTDAKALANAQVDREKLMRAVTESFAYQVWTSLSTVSTFLSKSHRLDRFASLVDHVLLVFSRETFGATLEPFRIRAPGSVEARSTIRFRFIASPRFAISGVLRWPLDWPFFTRK